MLSQLEQVNSDINRLPYKADTARYHQVDFWNYIDVHGGDCEDFALTKRAKLLSLGWDPGVLRLAICRTETGEGHAVLTVDTPQGTYVLDNRYPSVMAWKSVPYKWICRQKARGWVSIQ